MRNFMSSALVLDNIAKFFRGYFLACSVEDWAVDWKAPA